MEVLIEKEYDGRGFAVSCDELYRDAALVRLNKEISRYKESKRIYNLGAEKYAEELCYIANNKCPRCGEVCSVNKVNRIKVYGGLFYTDSKPFAYKECTKCGEQFETRHYVVNMFSKKAEQIVRTIYEKYQFDKYSSILEENHE